MFLYYRQTLMVNKNKILLALQTATDEDHCQQGLPCRQRGLPLPPPTTAGLVHPPKPFNGLS